MNVQFKNWLQPLFELTPLDWFQLCILPTNCAYSQQSPFSCGHTGCWRAHDDLHSFPFKFCSGEIAMNTSLCQVLISQCTVWKGIVATLWPTTFGPTPVIYTPNKHLSLVLTPPPPAPFPPSKPAAGWRLVKLYTSSCTELIRLATGRLLAHTDPHFALFCCSDIQLWPLLQWQCTTLTSVAVMYNSDLCCSDIQLWPLLQWHTALTSVAATYNSDLCCSDVQLWPLRGHGQACWGEHQH